MAYSVLDVGDCLMLSGESREEVDGALAKYVERGATVISRAVEVESCWTAACTLPDGKVDVAAANGLRLAGLPNASSRSQRAPTEENWCRVEAVGFKRICTGPSKQLVMSRVEDFMRLGANVVGDIVNNGDEWVAMIDTVGADGSVAHHWSGED